MRWVPIGDVNGDGRRMFCSHHERASIHHAWAWCHGILVRASSTYWQATK